MLTEQALHDRYVWKINSRVEADDTITALDDLASEFHPSSGRTAFWNRRVPMWPAGRHRSLR